MQNCQYALQFSHLKLWSELAGLENQSMREVRDWCETVSHILAGVNVLQSKQAYLATQDTSNGMLLFEWDMSVIVCALGMCVCAFELVCVKQMVLIPVWDVGICLLCWECIDRKRAPTRKVPTWSSLAHPCTRGMLQHLEQHLLRARCLLHLAFISLAVCMD